MKVIILISLVFCQLMLSSCTKNSGNKKSPQYGNEQVVKLDSPERINVDLGVGYLKRGREGDVDIAIEKFNKSLNFNPEYALAHSMLANAYDIKGLFDRAKTHYELSIKYNTGLPNIINNYANFLCQRGSYDLAISSYLKVVDNPLYKTPSFAYENAGVCAYKAQKFDKSETFFRQSLALNEKQINSLYYMMLLNIKNKKHFKARAFLQRLESLVPSTPEILIAGYKIENALGNSKIANTYLTTLKQKYPGSESLRNIK